jgi:diguanylate cyclase (GGDEF)-like protein/PAS domain S-box-containing protein
MNDRSSPPTDLEQPPASYAGRTRFTQLEYEAVLANASIGIAFTRDRKFFLCNPKFAEMFGWQPGELIGQPGEAVYPSSESYEALGRIAAPLLSAGKQVDLEWEVRRKDGSTFLARMIAKAISSADPRRGTVWIVEDVTAAKRHGDDVARLLREQEAIFDTASIGIVFVRDRRVVRCNERYEQMYGYAPGELNGKSTAMFYVSEEDYHKVEEAYAQFRSGIAYQGVAPRKRKDGSVMWVRTIGRAIDPRDPHKGSVWTNEDITEQRRASDLMQRLLAEQEALINNVVVGISFTRERKVLRCNRRFEELFGYDAGELTDAPTRQFYFTEEEYRQAGEHYAAMDSGKTHSREHWLRRRDGSGFWCRLSGHALQPGDPSKGSVWLFEDITDRKRADEEIRRLAVQSDLILNNVTSGILFARNRVIQRCNRRIEEMVGAAPGELNGQSSAVLFAERADWESAVRQAYQSTLAGQMHDAVWRFRRKDGSSFLCRTRGRRIDAGGEDQEWIWSYDDVTLEREAEERLRRALAEQQLILDNATIGIGFMRERKFQRCNRRMEELLGYAPGELIGQSTERIHVSRQAFDEVGRIAYAAMARGEAYSEERQLRRKDGGLIWCKVVGKAADTSNPAEGAIWIYDDISAEHAARESLERAVAERTTELKAANERLGAEIGDRRQAEERAQHLADHDALTGLPNRRLLEDRLTQALALSQRNRKQTAVMFVDLDRFKAINDSLGHAVGDLVLKEVALRLVRQLRIGDTVCRIGGDEFVVVLPEAKRSTDAANVAQKIIETLSQPVRVGDRELIVTPSIGIAVFPEDGRDAEALIRNADAAMYHAKESGRANYQFFTEQMNQLASRRQALENDLRRALQQGELVVHYQPIVDLGSGAVVAHEALVRWQHPARGVLPPAEFMQLAEDTGLIVGIGEWVLRETCRWATFIGAEHGVQVAVNLSSRQFNDPALIELVRRVLADSGLPAWLLMLEITESTAMHQTEVAASTLQKLKELGVSLAIDDFGSGHSSLASLRRYPVDRLKIDRSLIAGLPADENAKALTGGIVGLAHALGLKVIAVGVETAAQREFLAALGCDFAQGYLTGKPVDADSAAADYV